MNRACYSLSVPKPRVIHALMLVLIALLTPACSMPKEQHLGIQNITFLAAGDRQLSVVSHAVNGWHVKDVALRVSSPARITLVRTSGNDVIISDECGAVEANGNDVYCVNVLTGRQRKVAAFAGDTSIYGGTTWQSRTPATCTYSVAAAVTVRRYSRAIRTVTPKLCNRQQLTSVQRQSTSIRSVAF